MAPDGASEVNTELIKLRAELKSVCQHRDELERDVENLCMQGSFSFSSSSVLSDRIRQAEREVAKMTSQVCCTAEPCQQKPGRAFLNNAVMLRSDTMLNALMYAARSGMLPGKAQSLKCWC